MKKFPIKGWVLGSSWDRSGFCENSKIKNIFLEYLLFIKHLSYDNMYRESRCPFSTFKVPHSGVCGTSMRVIFDIGHYLWSNGTGTNFKLVHKAHEDRGVIPRQLTRQLHATNPSDFTRMFLKWLLLTKSEGLAKSFCDYMKPCTPENKVEFYAKTRFFRLFLRFPIIFPKFFNRFSSYRLHCVHDILTKNSSHKNFNYLVF